MSCNATSNPRNDGPKNQKNFNNSWILATKNQHDSTVNDKKTNITNQITMKMLHNMGFLVQIIVYIDSESYD